MLANRRLAALLCRHIHDFVAVAGQDFIKVIRRVMKFLRAEDEVHVRQFINQFLSPALRHAAHETEHDIRTVLPHIRGEVLHLADGFFFREIAHAAGVQQNHVGSRLGWRERVTLGDELGGDGLAVALVHLAAVSFDENTGHDVSDKQGTLRRWTWKVESGSGGLLGHMPEARQINSPPWKKIQGWIAAASGLRQGYVYHASVCARTPPV